MRKRKKRLTTFPDSFTQLAGNVQGQVESFWHYPYRLLTYFRIRYGNLSETLRDGFPNGMTQPPGAGHLAAVVPYVRTPAPSWEIWWVGCSLTGWHWASPLSHTLETLVSSIAIAGLKSEAVRIWTPESWESDRLKGNLAGNHPRMPQILTKSPLS